MMSSITWAVQWYWCPLCHQRAGFRPACRVCGCAWSGNHWSWDFKQREGKQQHEHNNKNNNSSSSSSSKTTVRFSVEFAWQMNVPLWNAIDTPHCLFYHGDQPGGVGRFYAWFLFAFLLAFCFGCCFGSGELVPEGSGLSGPLKHVIAALNDKSIFLLLLLYSWAPLVLPPLLLFDC